MKKYILIIIFIILAISSLFIFNYINLQSTIYNLIEKDSRNNGVKIYAHYDYFIIPKSST